MWRDTHKRDSKLVDLSPPSKLFSRLCHVSSSSSSSEEEEEEEVIGGPEAGEELTDQQVDRLAEAYGITGRDTGYQFTR